MLEKVTDGEPIPPEFKQVVSSIFETGGLDLANPMGLFEKLAGTLQLDARERREVQQHATVLQRALAGGDVSGLETLVQQTMSGGTAAGFDLSALKGLFASSARS